MDKDPFEKIFDQIAEIMQYAYDNAQKPVPLAKADEIEKKLDALEKEVMLFKKMSDELNQGGMSDYTFQTIMESESDEQVNKEERQLLKRAEKLKQEAEEASKDPLLASKKAQESGKRLTEKSKKSEKVKTGAARKGKFKSMGGYKNWKPL